MVRFRKPTVKKVGGAKGYTVKKDYVVDKRSTRRRKGKPWPLWVRLILLGIVVLVCLYNI